jgi:signal peptidase I
VALVIMLILRATVFDVAKVDGASMQPNLYTGQRVIANKLVYDIWAPKRGDVIIFRVPQDDNRIYVKRVIGVPGDEVRYVGDELYVNDALIAEEYLAQSLAHAAADGNLFNGGGYSFNFPNERVTQSVVPPNTVLAFGDNRPVSNDSRMIGFVPVDEIIGRADLRFWPLADFGWLSRGVQRTIDDNMEH